MCFYDIIIEIESILIMPNKNKIINNDIGHMFINNYSNFEEMLKYWNKKQMQINSNDFKLKENNSLYNLLKYKLPFWVNDEYNIVDYSS